MRNKKRYVFECKKKGHKCSGCNFFDSCVENGLYSFVGEIIAGRQ